MINIIIIDIEYYSGVIERIDKGVADVITHIGLIKNIPVKELIKL
jgi:hypothetical protein